MEANTGDRQQSPYGGSESSGITLRGFPRRLWSLASSPTRFFEEVPGPGGYLNAILFVTLSLLAIPLALGVLAIALGVPIAMIVAAGSESTSIASVLGIAGLSLLGAIIVIVLMPVLLAIGLYVGACIQHLFVMLFAGSERRGLGETFKIMAYAISPAAFISWIPLVNFFGSIWQIVLTVIGIREVHRATTGRAIIAVAAPAIIVLFLSLAAAVTAIAVDASLSGVAPSGGPGSNGSGGAPSVQAPQDPEQSGSSQQASNPSGAASAQASEIPDLSTDTSPGVKVQNVGFYRDEGGSLRFYGEALNEGQGDLVAPQIAIKLYNDEDEIVGEVSAYAPLPTVIEPGERGLWDAILISDDAPEDWSRTQIEAIEDESLAASYKDTYYPDLEASNVTLNPADPYSTPTVTAEVENTGEQAPDVIMASGAIYDEEGKLVDVSSMTSSSSMTVRPGESSLFEGYVDNPQIDLDKEYQVTVYLDGLRPVE